LRKHGYQVSRFIHSNGIRFGLGDADWRRGWIDTLKEKRIPVFLYPHAARPMVLYDGPVIPRDDVACMFTQAEGGVELMKRIGYPCPVEAVGWALTEILPFKPSYQVKNILFAPIHPNATGFLHDVDKDINVRAYEKLAQYCKEMGAKLTVRFCRKIEDNGLKKQYNAKEDFVTWFQATTDVATKQIRDADLIVSHQTYAYMAVAIGKPVLMMGEEIPPRCGNRADGFEFVKHWDDYKDYLMFPLDLLNPSHSVEEWVDIAAASDEPIKEWKKRFIGNPFDADLFVERLESYL
jgi:hypothetical protein